MARKWVKNMNKEISVIKITGFPNGGSFVEGFDSDPERVKNFSNHLSTCSRTKALEVRIITQRKWASGWFELVTTIKKCPECEGVIYESIEI